MYRRVFIAGSTVGLATVSGCLNPLTRTDNTATDDTDTNFADAPEFSADEDTPGRFVLLRNQPQDPNGVFVGDRFEIAIVLGNGGGEPVSGEVDVELRPPNDAEAVQTATGVVDDELPPGAATFVDTGVFEATAAGDWELAAGSGIEQVHRAYDPTVTVEERPDD